MHVCSAVSNSLWPTDCSPPGSSVCGILQARILEWVAVSSSRESPPPRDRTLVSCGSCIGSWIFYRWAIWDTPIWLEQGEPTRKCGPILVTAPYLEPKRARLCFDFFFFLLWCFSCGWNFHVEFLGLLMAWSSWKNMALESKRLDFEYQLHHFLVMSFWDNLINLFLSQCFSFVRWQYYFTTLLRIRWWCQWQLKLIDCLLYAKCDYIYEVLCITAPTRERYSYLIYR